MVQVDLELLSGLVEDLVKSSFYAPFMGKQKQSNMRRKSSANLLVPGLNPKIVALASPLDIYHHFIGSGAPRTTLPPVAAGAAAV